MDRVGQLLAEYEALSLAEAARVAGGLYEEAADVFMRLSLLYDRHDALNAVQPANSGDCFAHSFDEAHFEISDCAERWDDVAAALEDLEPVYFLSGVHEFHKHDCRLRGPYLDRREPDDWMARGYARVENIRVEEVTPAGLLAEIVSGGYSLPAFRVTLRATGIQVTAEGEDEARGFALDDARDFLRQNSYTVDGAEPFELSPCEKPEDVPEDVEVELEESGPDEGEGLWTYAALVSVVVYAPDEAMAAIGAATRFELERELSDA